MFWGKLSLPWNKIIFLFKMIYFTLKSVEKCRCMQVASLQMLYWPCTNNKITSSQIGPDWTQIKAEILSCHFGSVSILVYLIRNSSWFSVLHTTTEIEGKQTPAADFLNCKSKREFPRCQWLNMSYWVRNELMHTFYLLFLILHGSLLLCHQPCVDTKRRACIFWLHDTVWLCQCVVSLWDQLNLATTILVYQYCAQY